MADPDATHRASLTGVEATKFSEVAQLILKEQRKGYAPLSINEDVVILKRFVREGLLRGRGTIFFKFRNG